MWVVNAVLLLLPLVQILRDWKDGGLKTFNGHGQAWALDLVVEEVEDSTPT